MTDDIAALIADARSRIEAAADGAALEALRVEWLGKKGRITELMKTLGAIPADERKARGAALNIAKDEVAGLLAARGAVLAQTELDARLARERIDVTLPPRPLPDGRVRREDTRIVRNVAARSGRVPALHVRVWAMMIEHIHYSTLGMIAGQHEA